MRDAFEWVGGVSGAVGGVAAGLLPTAIVGAAMGARKAEHPEIPANPGRIAFWITVGSAIQALAPSAAVGYWVSGSTGAAVAVAGQAAGAATGIALFARGGSAELVSTALARDLDRDLPGETSPFKGALKGLKTGFVSGLIHNARAGYQEGSGFFSGLVEGARTLPESFRGVGGVSLQGSALRKTAQVTGGLLGASLCAPAGIVHGIIHALVGSENYSLARQVAYTAGGLAVTMASWPLALGALMPAAVAGAAGAVLGAASGLLAGRASMERVPAAIAHSQRDNKELEAVISDRRQRMVEGGFSGAGVAAAVGWRTGASLFGARPE